MGSKTRIFGLILAVAVVGGGIWLGAISNRDDEPTSKASDPMPAVDAEAETILVAEDEAEWPPFLFADTNAPDGVAGASVDLLREVLETRGYSVKVERFPWERVKRNVEKGHNHIMNNASSNPKRMQTYRRTVPIYQISHAFFYREERFPDGPPIKTVAEIDALNIGGMRGYNYDIYAFDTEQIQQVDSVESLFQLLRRDWVDLIIGYPEIYHALAQQGKVDLTGLRAAEILDSEPLVFYSWVSRSIKESEKLLAEINKGLREFETNGRKKKIFARYGLIE